MFLKNIPKNKLFITGAFITMALAVTAPTFLTNAANASPLKTVTGETLGEQGFGTVTCPGGTMITDVAMSFSFNVNHKIGGVGGGVVFESLSNPSALLFALPTQGQISPNNFKIAGSVNPDGGDTMCHNNPVTFSMFGPCGSGVTVQFTAANGERATFPSSYVACTG